VNARNVINRRVLLTAGGLTLLAGCSAPVQRLAATAQNEPMPGRWGAGRSGAGSGRRYGQGTPGRHQSTGTGENPSSGGAKGGHTWDGRPVYRVDDGPKAIALTIDDGPHAIYTPQVLRLLERYRVTATFSMIGIQVAAEPAVAREVAAAGHVISNHTWRHLNLAWLSPTAVIAEMDSATDAIHRATGHAPTVFRAPYGAWSGTVLRRCQQTGMMPLAWSVDPRDWSRPGVAAIVSNIMRNTRTGSIILEHDGGGNRSETVAALGIVIPRLLDAGYHFVTV
jgi:peptidoglycan/xylan/chitin deacetylase (PgdA/CDA1 family)